MGIAVHIGSQLVSLAPYRAAFERVAGAVRDLRAAGMAVRRVDLGGGIGIDYRGETTIALGDYAALVEELSTLQKAELSSQLEVLGIERFQPFLLAALALMMAIELIPDRIVAKVAKKRTAMHERWSAASGQ